MECSTFHRSSNTKKLSQWGAVWKFKCFVKQSAVHSWFWVIASWNPALESYQDRLRCGCWLVLIPNQSPLCALLETYFIGFLSLPSPLWPRCSISVTDASDQILLSKWIFESRLTLRKKTYICIYMGFPSDSIVMQFSSNFNSKYDYSFWIIFFEKIHR